MSIQNHLVRILYCRTQPTHLHGRIDVPRNDPRECGEKGLSGSRSSAYAVTEWNEAFSVACAELANSDQVLRWIVFRVDRLRKVSQKMVLCQ